MQADVLVIIVISLFGLAVCKCFPEMEQALVHERTNTPINATIVTACSAGLLALLLNVELLATLVSIGTLVTFFLVCCGVLFRRYHVSWLNGTKEPLAPMIWRFLGLTSTSVAFSLTFKEKAPVAAPALLLGKCMQAACGEKIVLKVAGKIFHKYY